MVTKSRLRAGNGDGGIGKLMSTPVSSVVTVVSILSEINQKFFYKFPYPTIVQSLALEVL